MCNSLLIGALKFNGVYWIVHVKSKPIVHGKGEKKRKNINLESINVLLNVRGGNSDLNYFQMVKIKSMCNNQVWKSNGMTCGHHNDKEGKMKNFPKNDRRPNFDFCKIFLLSKNSNSMAQKMCQL